MSWVLEYEFYLSIIQVVKSAEHSRVVDPKIQGYATRRMPDANSTRPERSVLVTVFQFTCHVRANPHRPADTVGLALLVLYGILKCVPFLRAM